MLAGDPGLMGHLRRGEVVSGYPELPITPLSTGRRVGRTRLLSLDAVLVNARREGDGITPGDVGGDKAGDGGGIAATADTW